MDPDAGHGDPRHITMQHLVEAARAEDLSVEQVWRNMTETMERVLRGEIRSRHWAPGAQGR
jgi:hypothetical protein